MKKRSVPLGDRHNGRQTCLIQTETDTYIVKPRSSKTEEALDLFCQKLSALGLDAFVRIPRILRKSENEHTECVVDNTLTDKNGVHLYYQRAGVLLFFTYLLGSTDLHCENLIAEGDMPVLIDLETLLTGKARGTSDAYNLSQSVMRSHLLCNYMRTDTGVVDVSGLSGVTANLKNIPHTAQGKVYLWEERRALADGFEKAYRFALAHKNELAECIHLFDKCEFRQILRPTKTYAAVSAVAAKAEDAGRDYATALLAKAFQRDVDPNRLEKASLVLQQEIEAVLRNEVPLFYSFGDGTALYSNGKKVLDEHLVLSPVALALYRLDLLSEVDLTRQLSLLASAIDASTPLGQSLPSMTVQIKGLCAGETAAATVSNTAVDGVNSVFCGLQSDRNGNVDFVSCGYSLYQGLGGVLCMYAALLRKTGKRLYADLLYRYYDRVRKIFFGDNGEIVLTNANASLADGLTGVLACLEHIGRLTEDTAFLDDARRLAARLILSESLDDTDYLNGIGALPRVFEKLGLSVPTALGLLFEHAQPITTGVAHGSSGLALSLCALRTEDCAQRIDKKLLSVVQWENEQYSATDYNWYDLRDPARKGFMSGWCSGAPGIGLARRIIRNRTDDDGLKTLCDVDIEYVKIFLAQRTSCKKDTLCCGTSSVLMAASVLGVPTDGMYAQLCEAEKNQTLRIAHAAGTNDNNVSLMQGLSGVAYTLAMYGDPLCGGMLI